MIVSNKKLYVNKEEGFIGWSLRKDEFIEDCSDLDDIIVFFGNGKMIITRIADKKFVGKGIIHAAVWKKGDNRTIYHLIYQAGKLAPSYMKRFAVSSITRDREYDIVGNAKEPKIHYFSVNPNGRRETVLIKLRARPKLKKLKINLDFGNLIIKGRASKGNLVTKNFISKVEQRDVGGSTLAARQIWWDEVVARLNNEQRGKLLGSFKGDDKILTIYKSGNYLISGFELSNKFDDDLIHIEKWYPERPLSCIYWNPIKELYFVKRFLIDITTKKYKFIDQNCELTLISVDYQPKVKISFNKRLKETKELKDKIVSINKIVDVKGDKAKGNQLTKFKVKEIILMDVQEGEDWPVEENPLNQNQIDESTENIPKEEHLNDKLENIKPNDVPKIKVSLKTKKQINIDTNSESPVELEWDLNNNEDKDEDGQMKIF